MTCNCRGGPTCCIRRQVPGPLPVVSLERWLLGPPPVLDWTQMLFPEPPPAPDPDEPPTRFEQKPETD